MAGVVVGVCDKLVVACLGAEVVGDSGVGVFDRRVGGFYGHAADGICGRCRLSGRLGYDFDQGFYLGWPGGW